MEYQIVFSYMGKTYQVSGEAYNKNRIVLPDGTVLKAGAWVECFPPVPEGLKPVPHLFGHASPEEIAEATNGVVAKEVI